MSFSLPANATDAAPASCIVTASAVSDAQQSTVSTVEQELGIALDEGIDFFSAQGALDAWRLSRNG
jgi:predicted nucleotidyltransferase